MAPPPAATEFYAAQQRRKLATLIRIDRLWQQIDPMRSWSVQFVPIALLMGEVIGSAQENIAYTAQAYAEKVTREVGLSGQQDFRLNPSGYAGWNGDGRTIEAALGAAIAHAGETYSNAQATIPPAAFDQEAQAQAALDSGRLLLGTIASTALADTARAAIGASYAGHRGVDGYLRTLTPPSCSRCIVLAGRFYRWSAGFQRHPKCDCINIPAHRGDTPLIEPTDYFHSLPTTEQDRAFTKAGAQAIRDGADISQVVNARQGMRLAQELGPNMPITLEGTTKRGWFGGGYAARKYGDTDWFQRFGYAKSEGRNRTTAVRLMPETIYSLASDRAEAIQLLKRYGFFL